MGSRAFAPSLAANPREDLHRFINELNVRYNIGIPIPDPSLTPAERRERETLASRIYTRLQAHFFLGGLDALTSLLHDFDARAKGYWSQWVKKPQGDADTLPQLVHPPLAGNLQERDWLQTLLNDILDKAKPPSRAAPRRFDRTQSGPAALGGSASSGGRSTMGTPRSTESKRVADVYLKNDVKRPKGDTSLVGDLASSVSRSGSTVTTNPQSRPGQLKTFVSTSTLPSDASAVFSVSGNHGPTATQETVEASTQEQRRPPTPHGIHSQPSSIDPPSSTMEDAILRSFTEFDTASHQPRSKARDGSASHSHPPSLGVEALRSASHLDIQPTRPTYSDISIFAPLPPKNGNEIPIIKTQDRLAQVWPYFPSWLQNAPFPIAWEVTRIAQSCNVDLAAIYDLKYSDKWREQTELRTSLRKHAAFQASTFPARSDAEAWKVSLEQSAVMPLDKQVVYSTTLDFNNKQNSLHLTIQPLKLDQSYRLGRRWGAERFLELLIPSPDSSTLPAFIKKQGSNSFFDDLIRHLQTGHDFCGRSWKAFYAKSGGSRKPIKDLQFGPDPRPVYRERVFFFAEKATGDGGALDPFPMPQMLHWALDLRKNKSQPILKLFQRISLVLSRTSPTTVFKPDQMKHQAKDILSPTGKVMNDGIARMSPAVARDIKKRLGLFSTPSAVQGRLGSAKGMWIIDTTDKSDDMWIETFPSQRKWVLDWNKDEEHRTLEVRRVATMPRSASFNLQFLPVIEDRAPDKRQMREAVKDLLVSNLQTALDDQKRALRSPLEFRQWVDENSAHKDDRRAHGRVPYTGGMPREDDELMICMLDAGFDPVSNRFLNDTAYNIRKRHCETLQKKLNIPVGRSAYLYMTIDFTGILAEGEVHIGFSTAYTADEDWSNTMVQGNVLVGRSPAHFISDIQKVRAVFKPELADLKDVIVFSSQGNVPLADKLSGGDYDGDLAWVCWDSRIVDNFQNADVQEQPDLSPYMPRDNKTLKQLLLEHKHKSDRYARAISKMMGECFQFNLAKSMLGICTNYKERLCYEKNNVCDDAARTLSTLLSNLVDQAKQGIRFEAHHFDRLRRDLDLPMQIREPLYKKDHWSGSSLTHIVDYLKFGVAKPKIAAELSSFYTKLKEQGPQDWDVDLAMPHQKFAEVLESASLLPSLKRDIESVAAQWEKLMADDYTSFPEKVEQVYERWQAIKPHGNPTTVQILNIGGEVSQWAQLKASTAFWMYCNKGTSYGLKPRFVWQMACRQLCHIKAQAVTSRGQANAETAPAVVIPGIYASLRPDKRFVEQRVAMEEGQGSHFSVEDYDVDDAADEVMEDDD